MVTCFLARLHALNMGSQIDLGECIHGKAAIPKGEYKSSEFSDPLGPDFSVVACFCFVIEAEIRTPYVKLMITYSA